MGEREAGSSEESISVVDVVDKEKKKGHRPEVGAARDAFTRQTGHEGRKKGSEKRQPSVRRQRKTEASERRWHNRRDDFDFEE